MCVVVLPAGWFAPITVWMWYVSAGVLRLGRGGVLGREAAYRRNASSMQPVGTVLGCMVASYIPLGVRGGALCVVGVTLQLHVG